MNFSTNLVLYFFIHEDTFNCNWRKCYLQYALALHKKYSVSGSDDVIFSPSKERLEKNGLLPKEIGWFPEKITSELDMIILEV